MTAEWNPQDYAQRSELQQVMAAEILDRLKFKGDETVLDIGCGNGTITAQIAYRVPQGSVLGVDPSHNMIAFASEAFGQYPNTNLN
jgi:trans-aconitate 2-methyltransferase